MPAEALEFRPSGNITRAQWPGSDSFHGSQSLTYVALLEPYSYISTPGPKTNFHRATTVQSTVSHIETKLLFPLTSI